MQNSTSKIFIGIDQTGAVQKNGHPKPLPACLMLHQKKLIPRYLNSLNLQSLKKAWPEISNHNNIVVIADCVLGLPYPLKTPPLREVFKKTLSFSGYGRDPAQRFFGSLNTLPFIPYREVEVLTKSNSVFQTHPFQKNIQTGTFRIWKDLATDPDWYTLYGFEPDQPERSPILEGYPTLAWKLVLKASNRQPENFFHLLKKAFPYITVEDQPLMTKDPNFLDAAVLALLGSQNHLTHKIFFQREKQQKEGWILGAGS